MSQSLNNNVKTAYNCQHLNLQVMLHPWLTSPNEKEAFSVAPGKDVHVVIEQRKVVH